MKKAMIAMSGGVDSSVAAHFIKQQGYSCIGVTMRLLGSEFDGNAGGHRCCSLDDVEDARSVAYRLEIPYYVFNFTDAFRECVLDRFVCAYENGLTPNPCIDCNRSLKFDRLLQRAQVLGCDCIVTGHYARIAYNENSGRYLLKKAVDPARDQSYFLYTMTQQQLRHTRFPLGGFTKPEVREIAAKLGFVNAQKHDSQDICFVTKGKYSDFIKQYTGKTYPEGTFVDRKGEVLGRHKGLLYYTVGQRRGLHLSSEKPLYVCALDPANNRIVLGPESELYSDTLTAHDINLISVPYLTGPTRLKAKIRSRQPAQWATVTQTGEDSLKVVFDVPQRAITKGQAVVLYHDDLVVGGGIIGE